MRTSLFPQLALCLVLVVGCAASGDDDLAPSGTPTASELCQKSAVNHETFCPDYADAHEQIVQQCVKDQSVYRSAGCGVEYDAYLSCRATATTWDCANGAPCGEQEDDFDLCYTAFNERTQCIRATADPMCPAGKPNAFTCSFAQPPKATCVRSDTAFAIMYCCP